MGKSPFTNIFIDCESSDSHTRYANINEPELNEPEASEDFELITQNEIRYMEFHSSVDSILDEYEMERDHAIYQPV